MEEIRLSPRERRILAEIEGDLDGDEPLARRLRTMGRHGPHLFRPRPFGAHRRAWGVGGLGALTLTLLVYAVATGTPALIWAFAAAWVLTLVVVLRLVVHWSRGHAATVRHQDKAP